MQTMFSNEIKTKIDWDALEEHWAEELEEVRKLHENSDGNYLEAIE